MATALLQKHFYLGNQQPCPVAASLLVENPDRIYAWLSGHSSAVTRYLANKADHLINYPLSIINFLLNFHF
jgi:hypothetical protein